MIWVQIGAQILYVIVLFIKWKFKKTEENEASLRKRLDHALSERDVIHLSTLLSSTVRQLRAKDRNSKGRVTNILGSDLPGSGEDLRGDEEQDKTLGFPRDKPR